MAAMMRNLLTRSRRDERGAEIIEFAFVLPLLLLVVVGILDFGFMFQRYEVVTNAAREGARIATLPDYSEADIDERVTSYLEASGLTDAPIIDCASATTTLASGQTIGLATVTVEYPYTFSLVGPIAALVGGSGWGTTTLRGTSVMRLEGASGPC